MPSKQISINLIGEEEIEHTPVGRIVSWAVTYGRYIMIGTEIIVLLAFISRFSLDRKLTDLKESVSEKEEIIVANQDFEKDFRHLQDQVSKIQTLISSPPVAFNALNAVGALLPADVYFTSLDVTRQRVVADAVAGSTNGFSQLIANLQAADLFGNVEIGDVTRGNVAGTQFQFTATIKGASPSARGK